jgi:Acetyl/propionyl-CoA carboxylase, alpha subunit
MYKVTINDKEWSISTTDLEALDLHRNRDRFFHIIRHNRSYEAELVSYDTTAKAATFVINGTTYSASLEDRFDQLIKDLGFKDSRKSIANQLKAPMPGLILAVNVSEGQTVKKGDVILILEAMKMENAIKAQSDCVVKAIKAQEGTTVEKGQVLLELA